MTTDHPAGGPLGRLPREPHIKHRDQVDVRQAVQEDPPLESHAANDRFLSIPTHKTCLDGPRHADRFSMMAALQRRDGNSCQQDRLLRAIKISFGKCQRRV